MTGRSGVVVDLAIAEAVADAINEAFRARTTLVGVAVAWWGFDGDWCFGVLMSWPYLLRVSMPTLVSER